MLQDAPYSRRIRGSARSTITKLSVGLHTSIKSQNTTRDIYDPLTVGFRRNKAKVLTEGEGHLFKAGNYLFPLLKKRRIVMPARNEKKKKKKRFL